MNSALFFRSLSLLLVFSACSQTGSGGGGGDALCGHLQDCAEKAGDKFSESECKRSAKTAREEADTAGCGDEHADYMDCAAGIDFSCSDDLGKKVDAECGSKGKKLSKCSDGKPGGGTTLGSNQCEAIAQRISDKIESCIDTAPGQQSSTSQATEVECTTELLAKIKKYEDCYGAAPCGAINGEDAAAASDLSNCVQ